MERRNGTGPAFGCPCAGFWGVARSCRPASSAGSVLLHKTRPSVLKAPQGGIDTGLMLKMMRQQKKNVRRSERNDRRSFRPASELFGHSRNVLITFHTRKVLIDEQRRSRAPGLFELIPIDVLRRILPADRFRWDFDSVVRIEEQQVRLSKRREGFLVPSQSCPPVVRNGDPEELRPWNEAADLDVAKVSCAGGSQGARQRIEQPRVVVPPLLGLRKVRDLSTVGAPVFQCQRPGYADAKSGLRKATQKAVLHIVVDVTEVLVFTGALEKAVPVSGNNRRSVAHRG